MYAKTWFLGSGALLAAALIVHLPADTPADTARHAAGGDLPWYEAAVDASLEVLGNGHLDGSAWLTTREGYAVTAAHVVSPPGKRIEVLTRKGVRAAALVAAVDYGHDAAVLKVPDLMGPGLKFAPRTPSAGDDVFLLASPLFRHRLLIRGNVASARRSYEWVPLFGGYEEVFPVAAPSPPGASGGVWLDREGRVVGLQSGMMSVHGAPCGIAFVAGHEPIQKLLADLESPRTPALGSAVEELWEQGPAFLEKFPEKTAGVVIRRMAAAGPCARAGLKDGDVIQEIGGRPVALRDELLRKVQARSPGETVTLTVLRPGEAAARKVDVTVGTLAGNWLPGKPKRNVAGEK